jgi:phosphoglucomutase
MPLNLGNATRPHVAAPRSLRRRGSRSSPPSPRLAPSYTDPVDGSQTSRQGLILNFRLPSGEPARVVFRLSGTGSSGATIRMYLERYERDPAQHGLSAPVALKDLAEEACRLVRMEQTTGRDAPTVIT